MLFSPFFATGQQKTTRCVQCARHEQFGWNQHGGRKSKYSCFVIFGPRQWTRFIMEFQVCMAFRILTNRDLSVDDLKNIVASSNGIIYKNETFSTCRLAIAMKITRVSFLQSKRRFPLISFAVSWPSFEICQPITKDVCGTCWSARPQPCSTRWSHPSRGFSVSRNSLR